MKASESASKGPPMVKKSLVIFFLLCNHYIRVTVICPLPSQHNQYYSKEIVNDIEMNLKKTTTNNGDKSWRTTNNIWINKNDNVNNSNRILVVRIIVTVICETDIVYDEADIDNNNGK